MRVRACAWVCLCVCLGVFVRVGVLECFFFVRACVCSRVWGGPYDPGVRTWACVANTGPLLERYDHLIALCAPIVAVGGDGGDGPSRPPPPPLPGPTPPHAPPPPPAPAAAACAVSLDCCADDPEGAMHALFMQCIWTIVQHDGPNHLILWLMALITSPPTRKVRSPPRATRAGCW